MPKELEFRVLGAVWLHGSPPYSVRYAITKKELIDSEGTDVELISFLNFEENSPSLVWLYKIEMGKVYPAILIFSRKPYTVRNLRRIEILEDDSDTVSMTLIRNNPDVIHIFSDV